MRFEVEREWPNAAVDSNMDKIIKIGILLTMVTLDVIVNQATMA